METRFGRAQPDGEAIDAFHVAEPEKGSPLTEAEVIAIRDGAECIAMPASVAAELEASHECPGHAQI